MLSLILSREGRELISQPIDGETITIGRSSDSTLQLVDPTISRTHCRIEQKNGETFVSDISRNGTILNGKTVSSAAIKEGDTLTLGPWTAKIVHSISDAGVTVVDNNRPTQILSYDRERKIFSEERLFISVVSPEQNPFRKHFNKTEITIGTQATCDLAVADQYVSREHCKLTIKDGAPILTDLGSTNGTFVDGTRITKITLPNEGTFAIGKTNIRYKLAVVDEKLTPSSEPALGSMLGKTKLMREVFNLIKRVAPSDITVCISGESGTGKELAARELHRNSRRSDKPFIALNCGAIPSTIIESMLFGHERGAFTGAVERQPGVFEQANGGTLFLDEIGEMDLNLQTRLLRVLEDNAIRRLGSREDTEVDVRLVIATNKDLKQMVIEGRFREDLFYRLYVLPIHLPPLRERKDDIPLLAKYFMEKHSPLNKQVKLTDEAIEKLVQHEWHGNVRELKNTLMRAMIMASKESIAAKDIEFIDAPRINSHDTPMDDRERDAIIDALRKTKGNQTRAARILGIARTTIAYKIGRYSINPKNL